jgi:four helix bundle protein
VEEAPIPTSGGWFKIAFGSACEVEYFLLLAHDLTYIPPEDYARLNDDVIEVKRMLSGLLATLAG